MTLQEAINKYLPKKVSGELSLGEIREELSALSIFTDPEIDEICAEISDQELFGLGKKREIGLGFLDNNIFSFVMLLISGAIFVVYYYQYQDIQKHLAKGYEVDDMQRYVPIIFMAAAVAFFVRHIIKIIKRRGK